MPKLKYNYKRNYIVEELFRSQGMKRFPLLSITYYISLCNFNLNLIQSRSHEI